jgi:hypothetical protein
MLIIKYPASYEAKEEDTGRTYACIGDETRVIADFVWDDIVKMNLESGKSVRPWARFTRTQDGIQ